MVVGVPGQLMENAPRPVVEETIPSSGPAPTLLLIVEGVNAAGPVKRAKNATHRSAKVEQDVHLPSPIYLSHYIKSYFQEHTVSQFIHS